MLCAPAGFWENGKYICRFMDYCFKAFSILIISQSGQILLYLGHTIKHNLVCNFYQFNSILFV